MQRQKIFCIGFHKTGTKSLHAAFKLLGMRSEHGIRINKPKGILIEPPLDNSKMLDVALPRVAQSDVFSDIPWPLLYRELDELFPGSKFILTTRDPKAWISSVERHFSNRSPNGVMEWIYGVPEISQHLDRCLEVFNSHNSAVREHFKNRPSDFMEIGIENLTSFDPLCRFLQIDGPGVPFPFEGRQQDRMLKQARQVSRKRWHSAESVYNNLGALRRRLRELTQFSRKN